MGDGSDPQTGAMAGIITQGFGAIDSAVGAEYKAKGDKATYNAEANIADINAKMAENEAESALFKGEREEQQVMLNTSNIKASQRAAFAARGIDMSGGGTPINVLTSTETMGQIDANTTRANAIREAWGFREQGTNYTNQALQDRAAAKSISPSTAMMTSLMTGASQVNQSWNRYQLNYGTPSAPTTTVNDQPMSDTQWNQFLLSN